MTTDDSGPEALGVRSEDLEWGPGLRSEDLDLDRGPGTPWD
jgi:hypothetical protein